MSLFAPQENEADIRETGGTLVRKGAQRTYGHVSWAPVTIAQEGSRSGVQTATASVVVARGILTGITATNGVGEAITVLDLDGNAVACKIVGIGVPQSHPGGDYLELLLRRID